MYGTGRWLTRRLCSTTVKNDVRVDGAGNRATVKDDVRVSGARERYIHGEVVRGDSEGACVHPRPVSVSVTSSPNTGYAYTLPIPNTHEKWGQ